MSKFYIICLLLLCFFLQSHSVQGQHTLATPSIFESVIKEKEPTCEQFSVFIRKNSEENYAYLIWKCGGQQVRVDVNEYDSVKDTEIIPNSLMTQDPREITRLKSIGDEAYLIGEGHYIKGIFNVIFRKGKVRVNVTAQSSTAVQHFAKLFADSLSLSLQADATRDCGFVIKLVRKTQSCVSTGSTRVDSIALDAAQFRR